VKKVFPNAEQRECFFHLTKNFMKKFRGFGQLSPATRAYREDIFYEKIASIILRAQNQCNGYKRIISYCGTGVLLILKLNVTTSLITFQSHSITGYVTIKTYLFVILLIRLEDISWIYGTGEGILHIGYLKGGYFQPLWFS
jgi:hypothetical protein